MHKKRYKSGIVTDMSKKEKRVKYISRNPKINTADRRESVKMTARQKQRLKRLIVNECCNYVDGICIVQDGGYGGFCPQMGTRTLFCPWLREAVLPLDEVLRRDLIGDIRTKCCDMCGKPFSPKSNRARFCSVCSVKNRKRKQADWIREKRYTCRRFDHLEADAYADYGTQNREDRSFHRKSTPTVCGGHVDAVKALSNGEYL